jgi:hypothetical protein
MSRQQQELSQWVCMHVRMHGTPGWMIWAHAGPPGLTGDSLMPCMDFLPPLARLLSRVRALSQLSLMPGSSEAPNTAEIWFER